LRDITILCTVGPSSADPQVIQKLDRAGVDIFRINFSHTRAEEIRAAIEGIQAATSKPLCLDLEGAQIRSGYMANQRVDFTDGSLVKVHGAPILGDAENLQLTPGFVIGEIQPGDLICVDFDTLLLQVLENRGDHLLSLVLCGGRVGSNKAVTVDRPIALPPVSAKDREGIRTGLECGVPYVALSFANRKADVELVRSMVGDRMAIISKIESKQGLLQLDDILALSDAILLDRGDMSREVSLELIPLLQKRLIERARDFGKPVYVATNLLESMVNESLPTRAEVNDVLNTLIDGASGLVLAAETAIGRYPVKCVSMIRRLVTAFRRSVDESSITQIATQSVNSLSLVKPNGGLLVDRRLRSVDPLRLQALRKLRVDEGVLLDAEQIATGGYSPLQGFMDRRELASVLDQYRLPDGTVWSLPIVLPAREEAVDDLRIGDEVALVSDRDGEIYALLHLEDIYKVDFEDIARRWYGTTSLEHPGVMALGRRGQHFLGGCIDLVKRLDSPYRQHLLTPQQTRHIFEKKGWSTIVGFHTRNVVHRAHEYMHLTALNRLGMDGLLIHPIVGPKKKHDFQAGAILKSYSLAMDRFYPRGRVVLAGFLSYSRYAGPREAVFTALCRKNYGCTHFIVGRDHTGVGSFYPPDGARRLFEELGELGIQPLYFDEVYYCKRRGGYYEASGEDELERQDISATEARTLLQGGQLPPEWLMRKEISELIAAEIRSNREVFVQ
jgi:pyruvate kinase